MTRRPPPGTGTAVPAELLAFNRTLTPPGPRSVAELLTAFDAYTNQPGPEPAAVIEGVPVREIAGWRVSADVYRPHPFPAAAGLRAIREFVARGAG